MTEPTKIKTYDDPGILSPSRRGAEVTLEDGTKGRANGGTDDQNVQAATEAARAKSDEEKAKEREND